MNTVIAIFAMALVIGCGVVIGIMADSIAENFKMMISLFLEASLFGAVVTLVGILIVLPFTTTNPQENQ